VSAGAGFGDGPSPLLAAAIAFVVVLLAAPGVRLVAVRAGMVDVPGPRSSHARTTPRGGGLALLAGLAIALAVLASPPWPVAAMAVVGFGVLLALLGLADDRFSLPAAGRLAAQVALALGLVAAAGGLDRAPLPTPLDVSLGAAGGAVAALWVVAVANFYNFLDGIDGLAALQGVVTGLGIALAGWDPFVAVVAAALAGACAAFLRFNWPPARLFLGDVGSLLLGGTFAALPLLASPAERPRAVLFVAVSLALFLADATVTLVRRTARGARFTEPHREHLYQRLVRAGATHRTVTLALGAGAAVLTAAALAGWRYGGAAEWLALGLAGALTAAEWAWARAREAQARRTSAAMRSTASSGSSG
jgi:Fuc2NAc and GlcNAc transferase